MAIFVYQRWPSAGSVSRRLGFYRTGNTAIPSADPENPGLQPPWSGSDVPFATYSPLSYTLTLKLGVRGHLRSSKVALLDSAHTTLYSSSVVNMPLSITVSRDIGLAAGSMTLPRATLHWAYE